MSLCSPCCRVTELSRHRAAGSPCLPVAVSLRSQPGHHAHSRGWGYLLTRLGGLVAGHRPGGSATSWALAGRSAGFLARSYRRVRAPRLIRPCTCPSRVLARAVYLPEPCTCLSRHCASNHLAPLLP